MTPRENYLAFFHDEPYEWIPMAGDVKTFRPEELHDNVARGFVNQQEPFPPEKFGGKGWFNVEWKYEYEVRGAIGVGRILDDVSEWREKLVWPDLDDLDVDTAMTAIRTMNAILLKVFIFSYGFSSVKLLCCR